MIDANSVKDTLIRMKTTSELCFELAEVMQVLLFVTLDYCRKHDVPLYKENGFWSLVKKARAILKEIELINSRKLLPDDFLQQDRSDEDLTESFWRIRILRCC